MAHGVLACFLVGDFRAVVGVIHAQIQNKIYSLHVIPYLLRACRLSDCRLHRQPSPELGTETEHQIPGMQVSCTPIVQL